MYRKVMHSFTTVTQPLHIGSFSSAKFTSQLILKNGHQDPWSQDDESRGAAGSVFLVKT